MARCLYTVERLRPIAEELGISLAQLALRWLVSQGGVTSTLIGARAPDEIRRTPARWTGSCPRRRWHAIQEISDEVYISMPYYYDMWGNWRTWNKQRPAAGDLGRYTEEHRERGEENKVSLLLCISPCPSV